MFCAFRNEDAMGLKANIFTPDLESLIDYLVTLDHYRFFVSGQIEDAKKRMEKSLHTLKDKGWGKSHFGMGSRMSIFDVFHKKGGEFLHCAPTRGRNTLGEDTLSVADEIERRFNSMLAISLHESLEIYLKTIYG